MYQLIALHIALLASSGDAGELAPPVSCIYSDHSKITPDNKLHLDVVLGIWRIGHKEVIHSPGTSDRRSIPVIADNPDYLIASTPKKIDGSFERVVFDKKRNTLKHTRTGSRGQVLIDEVGKCHTPKDMPMP